MEPHGRARRTRVLIKELLARMDLRFYMGLYAIACLFHAPLGLGVVTAIQFLELSDEPRPLQCPVDCKSDA